MQKDLLGPELNPAMVKAIAKVAEEYLGAEHAVTKAFGAVLTSSDHRKMFDMARELFGTLPDGQQNMIWLTAKSRLASVKTSSIPVNKSRVPAKLSDTPYSAADLSPTRVLH
jgi:hypothetical protein